MFTAITVQGLISDLLGRRRTLILSSILSLIFAIPSWYILYLGAISKLFTYIYLGTVMVAWFDEWVWGIAPSYLSERFATIRRASGVGFGYSSGIFISAWLPIYAIFLHPAFLKIEGSNPWFTAAFFLIIGSILTTIGAYLGPETKGVDLRLVIT